MINLIYEKLPESIEINDKSYPNSNKFETIIVSAAAKANARSGGISI